MVWFIIIAINIVSIVMFLGTTKYLDHIDRKAQKYFEINRLEIQQLKEIKNNKSKYYWNHGHE